MGQARADLLRATPTAVPDAAFHEALRQALTLSEEQPLSDFRLHRITRHDQLRRTW
jgi:hypothetical protein